MAATAAAAGDAAVVPIPPPSSSPTAPLSEEEIHTRIETLKSSTLLKYVSKEHLRKLALKMEVRKFQAGDDVHPQGIPHRNIFFVLEGQVVRLVIDETGREHQMAPPSKEPTVFGSLHVVSEKISMAKLHCMTDVTALVVRGSDIHEAFNDPAFGKQVAQSLCWDILLTAGKYNTPLLDTSPGKINFLSTTVAASVESFYRSAMNALLNRRLTKVAGPLFPDMHVQIVSRIVYINGLKGVRKYLNDKVHPIDHAYPLLTRLSVAIAPGLIMCPVSSVLEATNANLNPEPLARKWMRGYAPRCVREVIFAIGLNQMSDYWAERVPLEHASTRAAAGSLIAGVVSGYLSHVPHNLATMKLMNPSKSYGTLFKEFAQRSEARVPQAVPAGARGLMAGLLSVVAPIGVHIRTTQIVGSFVLLNGMIAALS